MAKTYKCLDLNVDGTHIVCIKHIDDRFNPFWVYKLWNGGANRRLIVKYGDFLSVICWLKDIYLYGAYTLSAPELVRWQKERTI